MHNTGKRHAQKHAFALVAQLRHRFHQRGFSESAFWNAIKSDYGVSSRSEIDELGYVRLAARLDAAKRHPKIFDEICRGILERTHHEHKTIETEAKETFPQKNW